VGATKVTDAEPGTIRGDFATTTTENLVHASDGHESAEREIALWFPGFACAAGPDGGAPGRAAGPAREAPGRVAGTWGTEGQPTAGPAHGGRFPDARPLPRLPHGPRP